MIKQRLSGTGVAIITPFTNNDEIDYHSLGKLIDYVLDNGVNYIVTLGTTGETPVLSLEEKKKIVNFTSEKINDRCPLVIGVGGNSTRSVVEEVNQLPLENASAILSASPYYNKPSQEGLFMHYKTLAESSPKPVILYNVPGRTGRNISAETTIRLSKSFSNICGIKEASGDMQQCMEILRNVAPDFLVVSGDDALALPQMACGMDGVISVVANCFPVNFSAMVSACMSGDYRLAKTLNDKLIPAYSLLFDENNPAGVKAFLAELGLIENNLRLPLVKLSESLHQKVKAYLKNES